MLRHDRHHCDTQRVTQEFNIDLEFAAFRQIEHRESEDDWLSGLNQLNCEIQIANQIGRVDDHDDGIRS